MPELKINDGRNMLRELYLLNLFLVRKGKPYFFDVVYNTNTLDLIVVKTLDIPTCREFVENYILSTEEPSRMCYEITKIYTLLSNIL